MNFEQPPLEIKLSGDYVTENGLRNKLKEYRDRIYEQKGNSVGQKDTIFKIDVLSKLLDDGFVNKEDLYKELTEKYQDSIDVNAFENAFNVIEDYNETRGKNNVDGTGLKTGSIILTEEQKESIRKHGEEADRIIAEREKNK